jgi:hypothetical protein
MSEQKIYKIELFVNAEGKEVRTFTNTKDATDRMFNGAVMVIMRDQKGQQAPPRRFDFKFPDTVTSLEQAFEEFDSVWKSEMDRERQAYEKSKLENMRKVVLPNGQVAPESKQEQPRMELKFVGAEGKEG